METPEFLKVLQQFPETTLQEAEAVLNLKARYPFSQVLHTLGARVSKDHQLLNFSNQLQLAALYSADRAVLKQAMQADGKGFIPKIQPTGQATSSEVGDDLATTVMEDLAKLHELRQNFELLFTGGPVTFQSSSVSPVVAPPAKIENKVIDEPSSIKAKKERIVQIAKTFTSPIEETVLEVEPGFKGRKRKKDAMDTFIDQIVVNKKELVPESEKHKEQIEIIDHFIKVQPSITGMKDKLAQNSDLSTIKTGEFGDHIISETLVQILLKQGKKEKAVEVLKKLIWKFPQKKAYFAAQIEELRK